MMKYYIIVTAFLLITLNSCKKFLDVVPETTITTSNFFQSQQDFEQAVVAIYSPLQDIYENDWVLTEMRSDNTHFIFDIANRGSIAREDVATFLIGPENGAVLTQWRNDYLIVSRANEVVDLIDNASFNQSVKDNIKGQALFLRAFAYFDLVKKFGAVPFFDKFVESYDETFKKRTPASEIYNKIVSDAIMAVSLLPAQPSQLGKATSGAANTLLADVYLTLGKWADAETALLKVTTMGYVLLPEYADIFKPGNKANKELIFDIQYLSGTSQGLGSEFPYYMLPLLKDPSIITGVSGSPSMPQGLGGWNIPTPDLISAYEDTIRDKRYSASIGYVTGATSAVSNPNFIRQPYIKKYQNPHKFFRETDQNWAVYRYAEVLLMLAESLNEQGKSSQALPYLNQVRRRGGLSDKTSASQSELRDIILRESRIELAFENKRWPDLVRKGVAVNVMNTFGLKIKSKPQEYFYPSGNAPFPSSFNVSQNSLVYPIPLREILVNPNLEQNPGY